VALTKFSFSFSSAQTEKMRMQIVSLIVMEIRMMQTRCDRHSNSFASAWINYNQLITERKLKIQPRKVGPNSIKISAYRVILFVKLDCFLLSSVDAVMNLWICRVEAQVRCCSFLFVYLTELEEWPQGSWSLQLEGWWCSYPLDMTLCPESGW